MGLPFALALLLSLLLVQLADHIVACSGMAFLRAKVSKRIVKADCVDACPSQEVAMSLRSSNILRVFSQAENVGMVQLERGGG